MPEFETGHSLPPLESWAGPSSLNLSCSPGDGSGLPTFSQFVSASVPHRPTPNRYPLYRSQTHSPPSSQCILRPATWERETEVVEDDNATLVDEHEQTLTLEKTFEDSADDSEMDVDEMELRYPVPEHLPPPPPPPSPAPIEDDGRASQIHKQKHDKQKHDAEPSTKKPTETVAPKKIVWKENKTTSVMVPDNIGKPKLGKPITWKSWAPDSDRPTTNYEYRFYNA